MPKVLFVVWNWIQNQIAVEFLQQHLNNKLAS